MYSHELYHTVPFSPPNPNYRPHKQPYGFITRVLKMRNERTSSYFYLIKRFKILLLLLCAYNVCVCVGCISVMGHVRGVSPSHGACVWGTSKPWGLCMWGESYPWGLGGGGESEPWGLCYVGGRVLLSHGACGGVCVQVMGHVYGWRTTWNEFSPPSFTWVLGIMSLQSKYTKCFSSVKSSHCPKF